MTATSVCGSCLCGAVRFIADLPAKWVAHCHCTYCRRAHGAAFVTWAGFEAGHVSINAGNDALRWYESSPGARRGHCSRCGSPMFFQSMQWPGELHIARALITDTFDQAPTAHVYFETHVPWVAINDELPKKASEQT